MLGFCFIISNFEHEKHKTMTLPENVVAVRCDVDTAWQLKEELRASGVPCMKDEELIFKGSYRLISCIGILWTTELVCLLMKINAHSAVPMPEFRAAFDLTPNPQPTP